MKKILSLLLGGFFLSLSGEIVDYGDYYGWRDPDSGIRWFFHFNDGEIEISANELIPAIPASTTGELSIPAEIEGYPVRSIGRYAFYGCEKLTIVNIPGSVTNIGDYAFQQCTSIERVEIPDSVKKIGTRVFEQCYVLSNLNLPRETEIGTAAFYGCKGLARDGFVIFQDKLFGFYGEQSEE